MGRRLGVASSRRLARVVGKAKALLGRCGVELRTPRGRGLHEGMVEASADVSGRPSLVAFATVWSSEQAQEPRCAAGSPDASMRGVTQTSRNAKGATAAVTRYGCRRVVFFGGSETAMRGAGVLTDRFA